MRSDPHYADTFGKPRGNLYPRYAQGGAYVAGRELVSGVVRAARARGLLSPSLARRPAHEDATFGSLVAAVRRDGGAVSYVDLYASPSTAAAGAGPGGDDGEGSTSLMSSSRLRGGRFIVDSRADKNWTVSGARLAKRCNGSDHVLAVHPVKLGLDQSACIEMIVERRRAGGAAGEASGCSTL